MRKTYKIGEVADILGVSTDTIRFYEKNGIVYSHKDELNGYRYFTAADVFCLIDVTFYRAMDIPVEEVCRIMKSYSHQDVKELLEEKEKQLEKKIRRQQALLKRVRATIEDYRTMEESLGVFRVREMPTRVLYGETAADSQEYLDRTSQLEDESPYDEKAAEQGFMAQKTGSGWQMTRMFWSQEEPTHLEEEGREVFFAKTVNTVVKAPWGTSTEEILAPALDFAAKNGLTVADEVYGFWVFTDYSQPSPVDYIMLWVPVK